MSLSSLTLSIFFEVDGVMLSEQIEHFHELELNNELVEDEHTQLIWNSKKQQLHTIDCWFLLIDKEQSAHKTMYNILYQI